MKKQELKPIKLNKKDEAWLKGYKAGLKHALKYIEGIEDVAARLKSCLIEDVSEEE